MADLDPGLIAVLGIAVVFIVWYFAGSIWNRRYARRLANELRDALLAQGGTSKVQPFGTTAFRMTTEGANPPLRDLAVVVTLLPREMPLNWGLGLAQGRRDAAVIEASLRRTPKFAFELVDPESRIGRRRLRATQSWSPLELGGRQWSVSASHERFVEPFLKGLDPGLLENLSALHVTAGSDSGIAASVGVAPGSLKGILGGLRHLAEALTSSGSGSPP
ncbi:MAG TPA: hypothetical protein VEY12_06260 [Thermoplasmata archaeon]|nr:hypothetical protein [Thermoplasmata archaeon]